MTCAAVTLERSDLVATLGRVRAVAQVYRPRHVIADAGGPLTVATGPHAGEATWTSLRASVVTSPAGLERLSLVAEAPGARYQPPDSAQVALASRRLDLHLRPAGGGRWEGAARAEGAAVPVLDLLIGGAEPTDIDLGFDATQVAAEPARTIAGELERWRQAGGQLGITRLALAKGPRRLQARGAFVLDEAHRPAGEAELSARGLGGLLGRVAGDRALRLAEGLGGLLGRGAPAKPPVAPGEAELTPLPPLRIAGGRVRLGPLTIPFLTVPPLY